MRNNEKRIPFGGKGNEKGIKMSFFFFNCVNSTNEFFSFSLGCVSRWLSQLKGTLDVSTDRFRHVVK